MEQRKMSGHTRPLTPENQRIRAAVAHSQFAALDVTSEHRRLMFWARAVEWLYQPPRGLTR